jgi:ribosomal protein S18 acetylase RimI-like enzyme
VRVVFGVVVPRPQEALLDNPVYSALCGPQAGFAQVSGRARRYPVDVAPFLAMPSPPSAQDWRDAEALVPPGTYAAIANDGATPPEGWEEVGGFHLVQLIGDHVTAARFPEAVALGAGDVPEMLDLVAETEPGPFLRRTIELGDYLGVRDRGKLVAMAGERFRLDGWTEISAVCTSPEYRGRGLATRLIGELTSRAELRSEGVFLHVLATNTGAIRLYEELGFRVRQTATIKVLARGALGTAQA